MSPLIERLQQRTQDLALPETHEKFVDEMSRFLAMEQANVWLSSNYTSLGLIKNVSDLLEEQLPKLEVPFTPSQHTNLSAREQEIKEWRERMAAARGASENKGKDGPKIG